MDAQTLEFDHFGPWVLEITPDDPPPPLFRPHLARSEEPLIAVKVPRRIERPNARPGMDLYDHLICLYRDDLEVMERVGRDVRVFRCRYDDIGYVALTHALLRGNLHLGLAGDACDVPFNTTHDEPIRRLAELIRERYPRPPVATVLPDAIGDDETGLSFYFGQLLGALRHTDPAMRLLAVQGTVALGTRGTSALRRFLGMAMGRRLLESMHCSDGRELVVLTRGKRYAYRWESVYGHEAQYVPLAAIRGVDWRTDDATGVGTLTVGTPGGTLAWSFTTDGDPTAYRSYLADLGAAGRPASSTLAVGP